MSEKIKDFYSRFSFGLDILKDTIDNQEIHKVVICLRKQGCKYGVISPATSLLAQWNGLKPKTVYEYAMRLTQFLNYAYLERRIKEFRDIDSMLVADYINALGKTHSRSYVKESYDVLKKVFYYAVYKYEDICSISAQEIIPCVNGKSKKVSLIWPNVETRYILPSKSMNKNTVNKLTTLDDVIVFHFLDIASIEAPQFALGFYFLFLGGLRASEVCNLTTDDMPRNIKQYTSFYLNLYDKVLDSDSKYTSLSLNKRIRKQWIIIVPELFNPIWKRFNEKKLRGPIVTNRAGQAITLKGFEYNFNKVKTILIKQLEKSSDCRDKALAFKLSMMTWGSHIGRGYYSNLLMRLAENPYEVSAGRGDTQFGSVLPYAEESEQLRSTIMGILSDMYSKYKGGQNEKNS